MWIICCFSEENTAVNYTGGGILSISQLSGNSPSGIVGAGTATGIGVGTGSGLAAGAYHPDSSISDSWRRPRSESSADAESVYMANVAIDNYYQGFHSRKSSVS